MTQQATAADTQHGLTDILVVVTADELDRAHGEPAVVSRARALHEQFDCHLHLLCTGAAGGLKRRQQTYAAFESCLEGLSATGRGAAGTVDHNVDSRAATLRKVHQQQAGLVIKTAATDVFAASANHQLDHHLLHYSPSSMWFVNPQATAIAEVVTAGAPRSPATTPLLQATRTTARQVACAFNASITHAPDAEDITLYASDPRPDRLVVTAAEQLPDQTGASPTVADPLLSDLECELMVVKPLGIC